MNTMINSTLKSSLVSLCLHACVLVIGSLAIYQSPMNSLELNGERGKGAISFGNMNFINKKSNLASSNKLEKNNVQKDDYSKAAISSTNVSAESKFGSSELAQSNAGSGNGEGSGDGNGNDFDQGKIFSQIKGFFEARLGSTISITSEQLIKIKLKLGSEGEIISADIVQGKLDFQALKKILSVAKNIPLKSFWKSTSPFPQELVIPLILTPN